tara:strand:- start:371 stop:760 length:390 start_codon:yes stop_codon:yes gene_type:complete
VILKRKHETTDRSLKVSEIIRKAVSEVLVKNEFPINPPFNFPLSVVNVEMNKDLKIAYIYVLTHEEINKDEIIDRLKSCKKYISKEINKLVELKFIPKLVFRNDETVEQLNNINNLLKSDKIIKDNNVD